MAIGHAGQIVHNDLAKIPGETLSDVQKALAEGYHLTREGFTNLFTDAAAAGREVGETKCTTSCITVCMMSFGLNVLAKSLPTLETVFIACLVKLVTAFSMSLNNPPKKDILDHLIS